MSRGEIELSSSNGTLKGSRGHIFVSLLSWTHLVQRLSSWATVLAAWVNFPRLKVENPLEQTHGNVFTEMQMCDTVRPSHSSGRIIGRSAENSLDASRYFWLLFEGE